jgi:NodT family efflux transporter outer membrane factor (OMF) lipoprotein
MQAPAAWSTQGPWQVAAPSDALPKGAWWKVFADPQLNAYEQQLLQANQSLAAAVNRLDEARAAARVTSSGYFPQLAADPSGQRQRLSGERPLSGASLFYTPYSQNVFAVPFAVNYEADLFGRVRRSMEAANASLQATAANLENVQLVLTAELAADYFSVRELDAEADVVRQSVALQQRGLDLVNHRHEGGIASGLEVAQQASLLDATQAQLSLLEQQRGQFVHAIAVLLGAPASNFAIPIAPLQATPPAIPVGLPSDLLQRRPDIAAAERAMAMQNAQVGIATAAFYPHITLSGTGGYLSRDIGALATAPSAFWSLGGDILQPLLTGGRNRANLAFTKAAYNESVANYRQSVLTAFQQVEDGLSSLDALAQASVSQQAAVADSQRALEFANHRYTGGLTTYLDVITAQSTLLGNQRLATQLLGQQMITTVSLIKALGGTWDTSELQREQVHPRPAQALQQ